MKNIGIINSLLVTSIFTVLAFSANAACVARHSDSFAIIETSSLPVDSAAALDAASMCISKAVERNLEPCNCWVACSPALLIDSVESVVARAVESYLISNGLPSSNCGDTSGDDTGGDNTVSLYPPDNHGCSSNDFDICKQSGASCFLSTNGGAHPDPNTISGDKVALCWWEKQSPATCSDAGGIWSTASNFGDRFDWSSPPEGWGQCMSQCGNHNGSCTNP